MQFEMTNLNRKNETKARKKKSLFDFGVYEIPLL